MVGGQEIKAEIPMEILAQITQFGGYASRAHGT